MRALIVDDNRASAQTLTWMIELLGHETRMAHSGAEALRAGADFTPDIVFLDIGLPGMDGYEVCRALRQMPALEKTIFVAQTGWGTDEHRAQARDAGFQHHMVKPIDVKAVESLLSSLQPTR
jgi:CheY-like chemotaxis protein